MREQKAYADLLKSPFYINLIVSKMPDSQNIQDENEFRNYIWSIFGIVCTHIFQLNQHVQKIIGNFLYINQRIYQNNIQNRYLQKYHTST